MKFGKIYTYNEITGQQIIDYQNLSDSEQITVVNSINARDDIANGDRFIICPDLNMLIKKDELKPIGENMLGYTEFVPNNFNSGWVFDTTTLGVVVYQR
jgi:hypothetical protein